MRERKRMERAIWEAEHPEEARQEAELEQRRYEEWLKMGKALAAAMGETDESIARKKQRQENARRADCCAGIMWHPETKAHTDCGKPFGPGDVIYLRREDITRPVLPYCRDHRCGQPPRYHNRDAREGWYYVNCWCEDKHWREPKPCLGCGRLVSYPKAAGWRVKAHRYDPETHDWASPYTFCGEHCRRIVFAAERKAKRLAQRHRQEKACSICQASFKGRRADVQYCSPACRQRAYRNRLREAVRP